MSAAAATPPSTATVNVDIPNLQALADAIVSNAHTYTVDVVTLATVGLAQVLKAQDARITALEAELFRLKADAYSEPATEST